MQSPLVQPQRLPSPGISAISSSVKTAGEARRPSINYFFHPKPMPKNATPETTKVILDFLLDISIQSRLKHADLELDELSSSGDSAADGSDLAERRRRRIERADKAEKDKSAVESIVAGVLSSHRTRLPPSDLSCDLQHRLYLAQLTNLVYSRFDALPSSTHAHHHLHSSSGRRKHSEIIRQLTKQNEHMLTQDNRMRQQLFESSIERRRCRRHRALACDRCDGSEASKESASGGKRRKVDANNNVASGNVSTTISNLMHPPPPGLIDSIPPFLKTSAMALRRELEDERKESTPTVDDETESAKARSPGPKGGMPPEWYDLFLELLTQAAIESYFCDGRAGLEPILEIFSYGDADDAEDPTAYDSDDDDEEEEEEDMDDEQALRAADHHLLFPKTRVTVEFAKRLREREMKFLLVKGTLEEHFQTLANTYPLQEFEQGMRKYIDTIRATMNTPSLAKYESPPPEAIETNSGLSPPASSSHPSSSGSVSPPSSSHSTSTSSSSHSQQLLLPSPKSPIPSLVPSDGALLMPDVPSDDETDPEDDGAYGGRERRDSGNAVGEQDDNDDDDDDDDDDDEQPPSPTGSKRRRND